MTKNFIFRFYECRLDIEETAKLCFKSVRTVKKWDKGSTIPRECKRLMRMYKCRVLYDNDEWGGFSVERNKLKTPTGQIASAQQILLGLALLEINSELEIKTSRHLIKTARMLAKYF